MFLPNTLQLRKGNFPLSIYLSRQLVIGMILVIALMAFEMFNFDTTQFALASLLGDAYFVGISWATILAIAFCAIDFAGLAYMFSPDPSKEQPQEAWYMMGAWLMGATLNALMTWWAVSLTLLDNQLGNEILSRAQILRWAPILIASLVWVTRILFIGSLSIASDQLFANVPQVASKVQPAVATQARVRRPATAVTATPAPKKMGNPVPVVLKQQPQGRNANSQRATTPRSPQRLRPADTPISASASAEATQS